MPHPGRVTNQELEAFSKLASARVDEAFSDMVNLAGHENYCRGMQDGFYHMALAKEAIETGLIVSSQLPLAYYRASKVLFRHFVKHGCWEL